MVQGRTGGRVALFVIADRCTRDQGCTAPRVEGFYLLKLTRARRVSFPVRIWFGPPLDPETREEMDRAPRWQIQVGFFLLDDQPLPIGGIRIEELDGVWPRVAREPNGEVDWRYRGERAAGAARKSTRRHSRYKYAYP